MTSSRERARRAAQSQQDIARMGRSAADLSQLKPGAEEEIRKEAERRMGYRCAGCGERIGVGLRFHRIDVLPPEAGETKPRVDHAVLVACNGSNGCEFADQARAAADIVEMIEFVWLNGDAPVGGGDLDADVAAAEQTIRPEATPEE